VDDRGSAEIPTAFRIASVSPNPFNPQTQITLAIPSTGIVTAGIFNISGAKVAEVFNGQMTAGFHTLSFNGVNLSSGVYFLNVETAAGSACEKIILMK